jgi:putative two-component system response regulator
MDEHKHARILLLGPPAELDELRKVLEPVGYINFRTSTDLAEVVAVYDESSPDLIILDVSAQEGFDALEQLVRRMPEGRSVPILALAPGTDSMMRLRIVAKGAKDFVSSPVEATEVLTRVANLLENRFLQLQVFGDSGDRIGYLVDDVARARTRSLEEIQRELLERFARTAEYRGVPSAAGHRERVAALCKAIATQLGFSVDRADLIARASLLHDIGTIGVPESVWQKPSGLTPEEFEQVKTHTKIGADILSQGRSPLLWLAEEIAHTHHERWDGTGYLGLVGEAIPIAGRIVGLADAFDALTSDRPYRKALSVALAVEEIERESGHQFDPQVVEAFAAVREWPELSSLFA